MGSDDASAIWPTFAEVDVEAGVLPHSSVVLEPAHWTKPPPFVAVDSSGEPLDLPVSAQARTSAAKVLSSFGEAVVAFSQCLLVGAELHVFLASMNEQWARSVAGQPDGHAWKEACGLFLDGSRVGLRRDRWQPTSHHEGRLLLATADEPGNWGLFTVDALQAAFHFTRNRDRYDRMLCCIPDPNYRALLGLAGIRDEDLVWHDVFQSHRLDSVSVLRRTFRDLYVHPAELRDFHWLAEQVRTSLPSGPRRVFLSRLDRSRKNAYRGLLEEEELADGLRRRGFTVVDLELLTPQEQIRSLASAELVCGLGGAGMFNTVYCAPGTRVLDLESTVHFLPGHTNLFASAGLDYGVVVGQEEASDPRPQHKSWHLDVRRVLGVVDDLL